MALTEHRRKRWTNKYMNNPYQKVAYRQVLHQSLNILYSWRMPAPRELSYRVSVELEIVGENN